MSISRTFVAANVIYSHKFAGHDALVSAFVATYKYSKAIFSVTAVLPWKAKSRGQMHDHL